MKKLIPLILTSILFSTNEIDACTCVELKESLRKKIEKAFAESDLIFVGTVIDKQVKETKIDVSELYNKQKYVRTIYTFQLIDKINVQSDNKELEISTTNDSCGITFEVGETYLVYSQKSIQKVAFSPYLNQERINPFYFTDRCTRTRKISEYTIREIKKLKRLAK